MAQQGQPVRWVSRRGEDFDHHIRKQVDKSGFGVEWIYFGCVTPGRADEVRRGLCRAGKHLGVAVKAYYVECPGCEAGGPDCRAHVQFTSYDLTVARQFMQAKAEALKWGARG